MKIKKTFRQKVGDIVAAEVGKSQAKMGDAMQLQSAFFVQCARDPLFLAKGLTLAAARIHAEQSKRRRRDMRRTARLAREQNKA